MNGACHDPNWTGTQKTIGDGAPPMFAAMFIMPETVPETSPPISMGTAGTGKTHLAMAITRSCIRSGARGRLYNVVDLVNRLETKIRNGTRADLPSI